MISRSEALSRTRVFSSIPVTELEGLAGRAREIRLKKGELLFSAGEPSRGLFVVVEGRTRALRNNPEGREQIIHEDGPGAAFPEVAVFDGGPYPSTVVALTDTQLLFIPARDVCDFCLSHPEVALAVIKMLSKKLRQATGMVEDLALRQVGQRLAEYLLQEWTTLGRQQAPLQWELRHSNQEIAELIGSVREVVSRSFAGLQRQGWIRKKGRTVEIRDRRGLELYLEKEP